MVEWNVFESIKSFAYSNCTFDVQIRICAVYTGLYGMT